MAEPNNNYSKRVKFLKGAQREFIELVQNKLSTKIELLALIVNVHPRTIRDWRREKFLMSLSAMEKLCREAKLSVPKEVKLVSPFWYTKKGGPLGGKAVLSKYGHIGGDPEYRKEKWYEWWYKKGQFENRPLFHGLPFIKARKSASLAELIGILMGDGGITEKQICISLHHKDDKKFSKYVIVALKKLFGIKPSVYHDVANSVNRIVVSRSGLVKYLNNLGLPIGNKVKQQFDIPNWIKKNKNYYIPCLRGLVDTDGCVFIHRYKVNGKWYTYKKLSFTTASPPLRKSVFEIFEKLGIKPRISQERDVRLDSIENVAKYFKIVGSKNPKHLNKYKN